MTTAEKYYTFLHETWPMNLMLVADLDRAPAAEAVEAAWREFSSERVLTRMAPTPDLEIVDTGTANVDFASEELGWEATEERLHRTSAERRPMSNMSCRYWIDLDRDRSRLCLVGHHAVMDARGGLSELQSFVRFLARGPLESHTDLPTPPASPEPPPWQSDRQKLLEILRDLGAANKALGDPGPEEWPRASVARRPRLAALTLTEEETAALVRAARQHDVRPFSVLASTAMIAVLEDVCAAHEAVLQLNVPVDLATERGRHGRPDEMNVGIIARRFRVRTGGTWDLAQQVTTALAEARRRGEGELFFHLVRSGRVRDLDEGVRLVRASVEGSPPAVSVTNLGVVDASADPSWLTAMSAHQAPSPNQMLASIGLSYRGRASFTVATDDERVRPPVAVAVLERYGRLLRETAGEAPGA